MTATNEARGTIAQLQRACEELAVGFREMGKRPDATAEDWLIAIAALREVTRTAEGCLATITPAELGEVATRMQAIASRARR